MKLAFLIDGFNVYHSIKAALKDKAIQYGKWLDYNALCRSIPFDIAGFGNECDVTAIYYFSALPNHLAHKGVLTRHRTYIEALKSTGINIVLGNFKKKRNRCRQCGQIYITHEEKETDVNIALYLFKLFMTNSCDAIVIISGDTDLVSAITNAKEIFSNKKIMVGFPFGRKNDYFDKVADFTFDIRAKRYERYQLNDPIILSDGKKLDKPAEW